MVGTLKHSTPEETPLLINRLSRLMGERRMSIRGVSRATGISYRALFELFHDRTTRVELTTLNRLCAYFDVGPEQLFEFQRTPEDLPPGPPRALAPRRRRGRDTVGDGRLRSLPRPRSRPPESPDPADREAEPPIAATG